MLTMLKAIVIIVLIGMILLVSRCSGSDDNHYVHDVASGANIFASTDMKPMSISFVDLTGPPGNVFAVSLPRAYVIAFEPYTSSSNAGDKRHDALPYDVTGHGPLWLAYLHPTGQPYTGASGNYVEREKGPVDASFGHGFSDLKRGQHKRWLMGHAKIFMLHQRRIDGGLSTTRELFDCPTGEGCIRSYSRDENIGSADGFTVYRSRQGSIHTYVDDGSDEIREVRCFGPPENAHPQWFCEYSFPLNDRLSAKLTFLDFRLHGGREFARARVRAFKQIFCDHLKCDDRALAAAGLR